MSLIPRAFINDVLARIDIVEIVDSRVPLRKKGNNYTACCPFHNEKTPSFTVSQAKQIYHCFGCSKSGNAISFLMDFDHFTFVEAVEYLANQLGIEVPHESKQSKQSSHDIDLYHFMSQVTHYYQQQLRQSPVAIDYLKNRGLSGQVAKEFAIGYAPAGWDNLIKQLGKSEELLKSLQTVGLSVKKAEGGFYDRFRDRIMFPIRDRRGRVIGFGGRIIERGEPKYLNSPETVIFHKGSELYGLYEACQTVRQLTRLIVVEGYMDVVALAQQGIHDVVATLGTATTPDHIQRLFRLTDTVIFCFDADNAGRTAAWRALEITLPLLQDGWQTRFLFLPEGHDPDSFVREFGADVFNQAVNNALSLPDFLLQHLITQVDITQMEGKARLAKLAAPLLNKMSAGIFQQLLLEKLSQIIRMDIHTFKQLAAIKNNHSSEEKKVKKITQPKRTLMRLAIALLVQHPNLIKCLATINMDQLILPGSYLLQKIINQLQQMPEITTAVLLEHWREQPQFYKQLTQLANFDIGGIPENGLEQEFNGILKSLLLQNCEQQIEQLLQKANLGIISDTEKKTLQNLIKENKT